MSALAMETLIAIGTLIIIGAFATATYFQVMTTSSAFILPFRPEEIGELVTIGEPVPPGDPTDPSLHLAERVIAVISTCDGGIQFVTRTNVGRVAECLRNSSLPSSQVEIIIGHFEYSVGVDPIYPYLQCVGFVRGIMAALGRDPGGGRDARGYLTPPAPGGYEGPYYRDRLDELRRDDLAIWRNPWPGHIVIVLRREGDAVVVAQA